MGGSPGVWAVFLSRVHENYKGEETVRCGGQRWLLHQWDGRCFQDVASVSWAAYR